MSNYPSWPITGREQRQETTYDIAQICPNGHVANSMSSKSPEHNREFCERCGEKTITVCPACKNSIRGYCCVPGFIDVSTYKPAAYCDKCGKAFPWTERAIEAAISMVAESDELNETEQKQFASSVGEVTRDTPKAALAATRIVRSLGKMSRPVGKAIRDILVDVASETAKKIIEDQMGGPTPKPK
jgi:hypothetical protein